MYLPAHFREDDFGKLADFIEAHSFATLVTCDGAAPFASHVPLLFQRERGECGTLCGHLARGNEQWRHLAQCAERGGEVLIIFQGPHAYVSPAWYESELAVPTWNYVAVHAYGTPRVFGADADDAAGDAELAAQLQALVRQYEGGRAQPWPAQLPEEFSAKLRRGIVGFEIPLTRLEGKWKLSQNRPAADKDGVIAALEEAESETERAVAKLMSAKL